MPVDQIEMLWDCPNSPCNRRGIRGLVRHCPGCGYPKDEKCREYFPDDISSNAALRGDDYRRAVAGPDWKCMYCGALQPAGDAVCSGCGCDRNTGQRAWKAKVRTVTQDSAGRRVETEEVEEQNPVVVAGGFASPVYSRTLVTEADVAIRRSESVKIKPGPSKPVRTEKSKPPEPPRRYGEASGYRAAPPYVDPPKPPDPPDPPEEEVDELDGIPLRIPTRPIPWAQILISAGIVAVVGLMAWILFRTRIVDGTVTSSTWEYRVHIDRWQKMPHQGWDPPSGAEDVHDEGRRVHHHDRVKVGSHPESYEEKYNCGNDCKTTARSCTSNKNGTATCTGGDEVCTPKTCTRTRTRTVDDYEDVPRYRDWYSWKEWEWANNRTVRRFGTVAQEPTWPTAGEKAPPDVLQPGQRERERPEESYRVEFTDPDLDTHVLEPGSLGQFKAYPVGRRVRLKVGIIHGVEVLPDM